MDCIISSSGVAEYVNDLTRWISVPTVSITRSRVDPVEGPKLGPVVDIDRFLTQPPPNSNLCNSLLKFFINFKGRGLMSPCHRSWVVIEVEVAITDHKG